MNVQVEPGKYIIAVSGGLDSVTLLNMLSKMPHLELIVAHFDHGIRNVSSEDAEFVENLALPYGIPFELGHGHLGAQASEAQARMARYAFLEDMVQKHNARGIITAHHKDDVLETAAINMLRGTKHKGLYSLKSSDRIIRPLIGYTKSQILSYANEQGLSWREDETNAEDTYLRNRVRRLFGTWSEQSHQSLHEVIRTSESVGEAIDIETAEIMNRLVLNNVMNRAGFIALPHMVAREVVAAWLRNEQVEFDEKLIERVVIDLKTLANTKVSMLSGGDKIILSATEARIEKRSSV